MPEYIITPIIEDIIAGREEAKEFALGLIKQTSK